jgi:hypothetical protein
MDLPYTGPLSFGTLAGIKNSINLFKNDIDKSTSSTARFSLTGVSTYMQTNSASKNIILPNMVSNSPYALSEFRGATHRGKKIQTFNWVLIVDGSDYLHIDANSNTIYMVHRNYNLSALAKVIISSEYEDGTVILPKTTYNLPYGGISSPIPILQTTDISFFYTSARYSAQITQMPNSGNNYHTIVLADDDPPREASWYNITVVLREQ